ncbi:thiamine phosphate synthase [Planctomycetota bacterium]
MERSIYRIIDANFNRAREAVRVMEEFCRFVLNSKPLSEQAKQFRHELSGAISALDCSRLIACRDTVSDVGVGQKVPNQLQRKEIGDCFTAACKRLVEALRVLAEMTQTIDPAIADRIENLRYRAYTLEKDIVLLSEPAGKFKRVRLYVLITENDPARIISLTKSCAESGADCIQLRAKGIDDDKLFAVAEDFVSLCGQAGVVSIINDRIDIAVAAAADGVHLGQGDLPIEQVRKLAMAPMIIGKSTHSVEQLRSACDERVTYAALGPVFATETKPDAKTVGTEYITAAKDILADTGIGHLAIGGITLENLDLVLKAGAETVAVCSAITGAAEPAAMCRAFKEKILE